MLENKRNNNSKAMERITYVILKISRVIDLSNKINAVAQLLNLPSAHHTTKHSKAKLVFVTIAAVKSVVNGELKLYSLSTLQRNEVIPD